MSISENKELQKNDFKLAVLLLLALVIPQTSEDDHTLRWSCAWKPGEYVHRMAKVAMV